MGDLIDFKPKHQQPAQMEVVTCGCGGQRFFLEKTGEVFCPACGYIMSNLQWEQIDDQGSGEG